MTFRLSDGTVNRGDPPNECPICHTKIAPIPTEIARIYSRNPWVVEAVWLCPNSGCGRHFIGYLDSREEWLLLPSTPRPIQIDDGVGELSESFLNIYTQAHSAEESGLTLICGAGYRKALEFLVKEYCIGAHPEETDSIKQAKLGAVIAKYLSGTRVAEVAKRAAWLGNDNTHFDRKYNNRDISDLKTLIQLTVHRLLEEKLTQDYIDGMPDSSTSPA